MILVTGGAGFIGSNFVLDWLALGGAPVLNVDKLSYAGSLANLAPLDGDPRHIFVHADICDQGAMQALLLRYRPQAIVHFAAQTHVDRSLSGPGEFIEANIQGTFSLLEAARAYFATLDAAGRAALRFLHVSTDEVYGSLAPHAAPFTETSPYAPNSPYAASKAASDHLVRAYHHSYALPVITSHCSNNYGPRQYPEKLIPLVLARALAGQSLPVYGDGLQVRDWLYVADHCAALRQMLAHGRVGEVYNVGGNAELTNLEVVHTLCAVLDRLAPRQHSYAAQIAHVPDRPGHDRRYAIDAGKLARELDWRPRHGFAGAIEATVRWYLAQPAQGAGAAP